MVQTLNCMIQILYDRNIKLYQMIQIKDTVINKTDWVSVPLYHVVSVYHLLFAALYQLVACHLVSEKF
jgi:hypothetical protein